MAREKASFLKAFLNRPFQLGAVAPSSATLAAQMIRDVDASKPVLEIGPGTGAITRPLLAKMQSPALYTGVDLHKQFVEGLRTEFANVRFIEGSAEDLPRLLTAAGVGSVAHIVSSLPWTVLPAPVSARILDSVSSVLEEGGSFSTFFYASAWMLPSAHRVLKEISSRFEALNSSAIVWRNLPPAIVYRARKTSRPTRNAK